MASGGAEEKVKIFDKRGSQVVRIIDGIHKGNIFLFMAARSFVYFLLNREHPMCEMEPKQ